MLSWMNILLVSPAQLDVVLINGGINFDNFAILFYVINI